MQDLLGTMKGKGHSAKEGVVLLQNTNEAVEWLLPTRLLYEKCQNGTDFKIKEEFCGAAKQAVVLPYWQAWVAASLSYTAKR